MAKIILALGANIGEIRTNFDKALALMSEHVYNVKKSSIYSSCSLLEDEQPDYMNIAIAGETKLSPHQLLEFIKNIEQALGRIKNGKWQERIIDIDIIDYDGIVFKSSILEIPHSQMHKRSFVILPMIEIVPEYKHPLINMTLEEIYKTLEKKLNIRKIED